VDHTVAVIVDPVADFRARWAGDAGLRGAADAVVDRAGAGADPACGCSEAIVDRAVAVVVDAVAGLGGWRAGRAGLWRPVHAVDAGAGAGAGATERGRRQVLVDCAVDVGYVYLDVH